MCKIPLGTRYGLYCLPCGGWTLCSGKEHVYSLVYVCLEQDMWDISWLFGVMLSLIIDYWQGMFRFPSSWPKKSYHHQYILVSFLDGSMNEEPSLSSSSSPSFVGLEKNPARLSFKHLIKHNHYHGLCRQPCHPHIQHITYTTTTQQTHTILKLGIHGSRDI